ncbi:hypothetical protein GGX14DRAFT_572615 [Mycena pura]|uniref:Uncharacterized protein n=1 Tax=Mycena pura TaxID=153505 RepID=A0AAD6V7V8_9AGAR|nr:hypothetical protein GGX14DRAFT_572615 [Mycena pura]
MAITKDVTRLTPQQESFLLGVEKSIKATRFNVLSDQRYFLDQQAKTLLKYRPQLYSFASKRELGEVVFTLKIAYQAINSKLEPNPPGSYYNDICTFASDIIRERAKHSERIRVDRARRQQEHRQELQEAREAAETLKKLQKEKVKNKRASPPPAPVEVSDGDQSDGSETDSVIFVKNKSKAKSPNSDSTGEAVDTMVVDDPNEMKDATPSPPPNTPLSEGESLSSQHLIRFLNSGLDKSIPKDPRADRETPRSMVPRKRPREETEVSPDHPSAGEYEGETIGIDSSYLPVGVVLGTLPDSQSSVQRPSLREQVSDIRYAVRKHSAKIRRLLVEHNRLETAAEREYCENGGKLAKPHPHLFTISAELSANLRARDVLNLQLSDLLGGGSDGVTSEPSTGSKASNPDA